MGSGSRRHGSLALVAALAALVIAAAPAGASTSTSAYVWDAAPTAASLDATSSPFAYNGAGGSTTITRLAVGQYRVTFAGLNPVRGGTAHVTAYGSAPAECKAGNWGYVASGEFIVVMCFSSSGAPMDAQWTAVFTDGASSANDFAFAWADDPTAPSSTPVAATQFDNHGGTIHMTHGSTGAYRLTIPGFADNSGTVKVTAFGGSSKYCRVVRWGAGTGTTTNVDVRCDTAGGVATNARFEATFARADPLNGVSADPFAYVYADQPAAPSYTPAPAYSYVSTADGTNTDGRITIVRNRPGRYVVHIPSESIPTLDGPKELAGQRGDVQVTSYGGGTARCQVRGWGTAAGSAEQVVKVDCYSVGGAPRDSRFVMQFLTD